MYDGIEGDVLVIYGNLKPEVKFVSAERFSQEIDNPEEMTSTNQFYLMIIGY